MKKVPDITPEIIAEHGITEDEYQRIVKILGRHPNYTELGIFSVMWSEHCSYKSSKVHLQTFPTEGPHVLHGPGENAGVVDIGDDLAVVFKMESHNHPSFIEPYQGAATGVGGILRDIFTMGARPIASLNSLRFGSINAPRMKYLVEGVVAGIAGYGNCMGIPTVGGEICFHPCYNGNILVNAFNLGVVKKEKIFLAQASGIGNPVIYVGSKTGRDGIHGVTMASEEFGEGSEERRPTVQVGDPFTEKLLLEACLEAMSYDYIVSIQDMGGAGLTCSSCEMAGRGGTGIELDLTKIPRREEGMVPYELMLSESQERMLLVVQEGFEDKIIDIFKKWDLDAVVAGRVTDDGILRVRDNGEVVAEIPARSISEDAPVYNRPMREPSNVKELRSLRGVNIPLPGDFDEALVRLMASSNLAQKKWVWRQYDHMVRTNTTELPGSDATVIRIKGTQKAVALSADCNSLYCYLDPYCGGLISVAESARNVVCAGAKPLAITDCLNFGNPEKPEIMWQFAEAVRGVGDACRALGTPVTGGNVSFYNETNNEGIYPTPIVAMVGLIEDYRLARNQWFKNEGDLIVLLGETREELGGSEYLRLFYEIERGAPPSLDLEREKAVQKTCLEAIHQNVLHSAHDCSEGGVAVALAECCLKDSGGNIGASINLEALMRPDALLFGETQSRIIVSLDERNIQRLTGIAEDFGTPCKIIGHVGGDRLVIHPWIDVSLEEIEKEWSSFFPEAF